MQQKQLDQKLEKKVNELEKKLTEARKREEVMKENVEKYRQLFENESDAVMVFDAETLKFEDANRATLNLYGYSKQEFLALNVEDISAEKEKTRIAVQKVKDGEPGSENLALRYFRKKDGAVFSGEICAGTFISSGCKKIIGAVRDITERKRAEERIHALTHQLMKAQEGERQRISLYLRDDVAQNLSTLKIGLETIFDDPQAAPPALRQKIAQFSQILQTAISAVRGLAYDQRPPGLDQLGLVQAIFQYCEEFSETGGVRVDFQSAGMDDLKLDFDTEINLYRLVQEGLTNVRKHAGARHATVRLVAAHPNIILRIEDDGKGFDVEGRLLRAFDEKRMGLQGMEERVNLLNGELRIHSGLGEGTKIFAEVPYKGKRIGSEKKHPNH